MSRRRTGRIRTPPSDRAQDGQGASAGRAHPAPDKEPASAQPPDHLLLRDYAATWLDARPDLKIRTRELYSWLLGKYVLPFLGDLPLDAIAPSAVRSWHAGLLRDAAPTPTRQAYSLLRAMLNTAVADELLARNPCKVRGAGVSRSGERTVATVAQVHALAEAVPPRYRMLVLLAAWSGARWGELVALSREQLDLEHGTLTIDRQYVELRDGTLVLDTPKSAAGVRTVHIPPHLLPELVEHLERYTTARSTVVFPNSKDAPIRRSSFRSVWLLARRRAGLPELRFHDLRHTGNTLAAATGASTKELMARMGHASMRAALIYQHATSDRDAAIATALSQLALGEAATNGPGRAPLRAAGRARPRATGT